MRGAGCALAHTAPCAPECSACALLCYAASQRRRRWRCSSGMVGQRERERVTMLGRALQSLAM
eukprot:6212957-Pleurochrysis_carterae.AAC.4